MAQHYHSQFSFVTVLFFFGLYIGVVGIVIYYGTCANPHTNRIAHVLHITIPKYIYHTLQRICPVWLLEFLQVVLVQNIFVVFYLVLTLGCWSIVFGYIYPWISLQHQHLSTTAVTSLISSEQSNIILITIPLYHQYIGVIVFIICMMSYRIATQSSPGIIASTAVIPIYNHYPYDDYLYEAPERPVVVPAVVQVESAVAAAAPAIVASTSSTTTSTNTTTTNTSSNTTNRNSSSPLKLARSKYDRMKYHHYIPKYDHYCFWMNNTFGEENYRYFLLFLFVHVLMCGYGSRIIGRLLYNDVYIIHQFHIRTFMDASTKQEIPVTTYILFQYLISVYLYEMAVLMILMVMCIALFLFLTYHVYLVTFTGLTSQEMYKWSQIQTWYRTELKLYHQQQQEQQQRMKKQHDSTNHDKSHNNIEIIEHPGPKPINIYHYGMIRNWKHVLYPISIHKRRRRRRQPQPRSTTSVTIDRSQKQS